MAGMTIQSMENLGIVFEDLDAAVDFFVSLGMNLQGRQPVEGDWVDRTVGLDGVKVNIAMLETADGKGRLELMQFDAPMAVPGQPDAPPNTLGIRRVAFMVDDVDAAVATVRAAGHELLGEIVNYEDIFRMCYVRGPEGVIVMLSERIG